LSRIISYVTEWIEQDKNFKLKGCDLFYTEAIRVCISKLGIEYVSSLEDIDILEDKITTSIKEDKNCVISSKVDKAKLVSAYFNSLRVTFLTEIL